MLKRAYSVLLDCLALPAAFRRLCVETCYGYGCYRVYCQPPSGGCVLKQCEYGEEAKKVEPAAFRRLCVETAVSQFADGALIASRLQAAVC